jgi:DNA-binding NarL/FixJ family response regulator
MRLIVVGAARARRELREQLEASPLDVVAEFESLADARESGIDADAIVLPAPAESPPHDDLPFVEPLTARETSVLELVAEGLPNKAIAERLGISDQTVKFHLASVLGKLGAANRTDAVRRAVRAGLITL